MQISFKYANSLGKEGFFDDFKTWSLSTYYLGHLYFLWSKSLASTLMQEYREKIRDFPIFCSPSEESWPVWEAKMMCSVEENGCKKSSWAWTSSSEIFIPIQQSREKVAAIMGLPRTTQGWGTWSAEYPKFTFSETQQLVNDYSRLQELFGRPGECNLYNK